MPAGNRINTVHTDDVAAGAFAVAQWMSKIGRAEADKIAGEDIAFTMDKAKAAGIPGEPGPKEKVIVPLFNLVRTSHRRCEANSAAGKSSRATTGRRLRCNARWHSKDCCRAVRHQDWLVQPSCRDLC